MVHGNCFSEDEVNPRICRTLSSIKQVESTFYVTGTAVEHNAMVQSLFLPERLSSPKCGGCGRVSSMMQWTPDLGDLAAGTCNLQLERDELLARLPSEQKLS